MKIYITQHKNAANTHNIKIEMSDIESVVIKKIQIVEKIDKQFLADRLKNIIEYIDITKKGD